MKKQKYTLPSFNKQIANARLRESFIYTCEMIFDESETMKEGKERIIFQLMQEILQEEKNYGRVKTKIDAMLKKLKDQSE